jgi:iron complex outermembrane receptor protein
MRLDLLLRRPALATAGALLASPAGAQAPDSTRDTARTLAPVVVTAARSDRDAFALPLALTRVSRSTFYGTAGRGLDEALGLVPGVIAQSRAGGSDVRITIRGFGARGAGDRSNAGTTRGIRILLDGFPETEPDGRTSLDGIDLASTHGIEVVRSNASAVWGNAAGGVINVSSVPPFDARLLETELAVGGFGLRRGAVRGSAAAGAGQLVFSAVRTTFQGWRARSDSRRSLVNLAFRSDPEERTRVGVYAVASDNFYDIPGPLTATQLAQDPAAANPTYAARFERRHNKVGRVGVTVAHDATPRLELDGLFYVQPKFLQRSERGTFRDFTRYHLGGQAGVRLLTRYGARVAGVLRAGADASYQDGAVLFYSLAAGGTRGDTLRNNQREGARNAGVYVQQELEIGRTGLTLGARYDDVTYIAEDYFHPALNGRRSFTHLSPKLGVTYRLGPAHSLYAALGGGIEAPAGNETDPASTFGQDTVTALNPLLDPIRSTTYEIGTRRTLALGGPGRELSYDLALYDTEVRDEIVPYRGGRFYFSAGRVRRAGIELGLGARSRGVALQAALAYAHHRYRAYVVDSVHYGAPGALADYSGNRVVGVPAWTYTVSGEAAPAFARPLWLRVTVQGSSSYFADDANTVRVDGYKIVNATLGTGTPLRIGGAGLRGYVAVNNAFDRPYIASAFLNPDVVAGEPVAFEPGLPRHLVVGITLGRN